MLITLLLVLLLLPSNKDRAAFATTEMPFNSKFVQPMYEIMTAFNLDPEQNWSEGAPCSDDGTGSGFKGVICDSNGNPRAMIPTLGNSLVGLRSLPTAFARLTTLTRLVLIMGLINTRLDDFARPLSCLPNLRHLVLDGNSFYGPVPPYLINSPTLTHLSLQGNKLTGTIRAIGPKLTALFLSVNFLTGALPPAPHLRVCNAAMNCLSRTAGCNGVTGFPRRQRTIGCRRNPCAKPRLLNTFQCKWAKSCIPQYGDWPPWEVDALSNPPDKGWKCNSCPTGTYATRRRCVPCSKPFNVRRMMTAASPPALGQFRPPPLPIPGAPMFPMGGAGGGDSGEVEEGRRKERERREELIAAVREGRGSWQEVAAAIRQLQQAGMTAEEVADVAMMAHGRQTELVVAAQVQSLPRSPRPCALLMCHCSCALPCAMACVPPSICYAPFPVPAHGRQIMLVVAAQVPFIILRVP
ncbi:unnamed protein product [Closterium sp. Yama58-4]|nr:unnamed protein product [Closterium sp. Yama58-4]